MHEPQYAKAKRLAKVLGITVAFLYCEDDKLGKWLLLWREMSTAERKKLVKQPESDHKAG